ncbi:uncharacterized protein LOC103463212 isoform X4 [Poecilia reticulata]|uniref:uncharacterized protein LOC103463212 isoform X4 n=1 Tax=Poecilia reticulata TaxID=8081 RepID=UPI0007EA36BE|nr:PREDICTED: uncharacterized protein LOC103463212 isoform X4 [Poecilia reticulata]
MRGPAATRRQFGSKMEDLGEPTLLQVKEEEEELVQIKEEEEEMVQIKEEEEELCIKQEGSDDEGSGSSRDLICDAAAEAAGDPAANQTSAGPNRPAAAGGQTGTSAAPGTFRSVEKRQRARKLRSRLSLVHGLISESLLLLGKTPGRRSARRRSAVRHPDGLGQTKATVLLHATRTLLHSVTSDLKVISRDSCDSSC